MSEKLKQADVTTYLVSALEEDLPSSVRQSIHVLKAQGMSDEDIRLLLGLDKDASLED